MTTQIASTILAQLGGSRFLAMTGAKNLLAVRPGLQFDLPRGAAKNGANKVRITLADDDTYSVEFSTWSTRALAARQIARHDGIHAMMLRSVFTQQTGLDCTLGTMGRAA